MSESITRYDGAYPTCPLCGSTIGERCTTSSGRNVTGYYHAAREAANEAYNAGEAAHYAKETARVELANTSESPAAKFDANNMTCNCGQHHSLMTGQALVKCSCGATFQRPELGYLETATVKGETK